MKGILQDLLKEKERGAIQENLLKMDMSSVYLSNEVKMRKKSV